MKKNLLFIGSAIFMLLAVTNCSKEIIDPSNENDIQKGSSFELIATPVETRTENDGMNTKWVSGDAINVFHAEESTTNYVSDGEFTITDVSTNRFQGTVSETLAADKKYDWYMFYPYSSHITTPANTNAGYTPIGSKNNGVQTQNGNNSKAHLAGTNYPLFGKITGVTSSDIPKVKVNQGCSFIEFKVTNNSGEDLTVSTVKFTATEDIIGTYYINFTNPDNVIYTPSANTDGSYLYVSNAATLQVTNGDAIADKGTASFYMGIKPFSASSGTLKVSVNGYEKEISLSKETSFSAGKIKVINYNYDYVPEDLNVFDNTTDDYELGFESNEGFTATSSYNNAEERLDGPEGYQWASYYGTVSTNSKLKGEQSMQMRWYSSTASNIGYARTNFKIAEVGSVSFYAAATNNLNLSLFYMTEEDEDWVLAQTFTLASTSKQYSYAFSAPVENAQLKFQIALPETNPTSTSNVRIDDVVVSKDVPTIELSSIKLTTLPTKTIYSFGEEFDFTGAEVTATYSDGSTKDVTALVITDGQDVVSEIGENKTVTVSYTEGSITKTTSYKITVTSSEGEEGTVIIYAAALDDNGVLSQDDFTLTFVKNNGSTAPTYNASNGDLRLYAKGTVTINGGGNTITKVVFKLSSQGKKRLAPITANPGSVATQSLGDETVTWTGSAESVSFTVGDYAVYGSDGETKAGQLCFTSVDIIYE